MPNAIEKSPSILDRAWVLPLFIVLFLMATIPLLSDFGPGWDITILYFGERYLDFYLGGFEWQALDFDTPLNPAYAFDYPSEGPELAWPVGLMAAAATRRVFQEWLGWLDPVEGYNLAAILWLGLTIFAVGSMAKKVFGTKTALVSGFLIATYPSLLGMSLQNPKDLPSVGLFTLALTTGALALEKSSYRRSLWFVVVLGLALGAKTNAIFVPPILIAWLMLLWVIPKWRSGPIPWRLVLKTSAISMFVVPGIVFALWPWLWFDTWEHLSSHWMRVGQNRFGGAEFGAAFLDTLWVTPPVVLVGFVVGLFACLKAKVPLERRFLILAVLWLLVPIVRASIPGVKLYDGVRRFLEYAPPLCLIAGYGIVALSSRLPKRIAPFAILALSLGAAVPAVRTHPFQIAYFNFLIGGTQGASERGKDGATDYWATSYRMAFEWLSANAAPGTQIIAPVAPHVATMNQRLYGLPDMRVIGPPPFIRPEELPDQTYYVLYVTKPDYYDPIAVYLSTKPAEFERTVDSVPMVRIHRIEAGSALHRELAQVSEFSSVRAKQRLDQLKSLIDVETPDPRIIGSYVGQLYELEGLDAARSALSKIVERVDDPQLLKELEYFDHQLIESQRYWHRDR